MNLGEVMVSAVAYASAAIIGLGMIEEYLAGRKRLMPIAVKRSPRAETTTATQRDVGDLVEIFPVASER